MVGRSAVKTVVLPWYRRGEFSSFRYRRTHSASLDEACERWCLAAQAAVNQFLAQGCAVELVSIEAEQFKHWLEEKNRTDSAASRLDYVKDLAARRRNAGGRTPIH